MGKQENKDKTRKCLLKGKEGKNKTMFGKRKRMGKQGNIW